MKKKRFGYLVTIEFLGYRYHGWQKQPEKKTIHHMVDRTLKYILKERVFKTLGASRTDAMVSANEAAFELFIHEEPLENTTQLLHDLNTNLPQDIRAKSIQEVSTSFNIIQDSKFKEYHYVFAHGKKFHPFAAPILTTIIENLDIELMREGAKLFKGKHNFKSYCYKPNPEKQYHRELLECEIVDNDIYTASFFPEKSYLLKVKGKGFGRHQIRLMMGALIRLGKRELSLNDISNSLRNQPINVSLYVAPASGLILHQIKF